MWVHLAIVSLLAAGGADEFSDPQPTDVPRLIRHLADPNVRQGAATALARIGRPAVTPLSEALQSPHVDVRIWSAETLGRIGPPAAPACSKLIGALTSDERDLRAVAARALGRIGSDDAPIVASLVKCLEDRQPRVRCAAADALGHLGSTTAILPLVTALADPPVRRAARSALEQFDSTATAPLVAALDDNAIRLDAAAILRRIDPAAARHAGVQQTTPADLPALTVALGRIERDLDARLDAARQLARLGEAAVPVLVRTLDDDDPKMSHAAAEALTAVGQVAVPDLRAALSHSSPQVRSASADALAGLGTAAESAVPELGRRLSDSDSTVRYHAARALDRLGRVADAAVAPLIVVMQDPRESEGTRQLAVKALGQMGPAVRPQVIRALTESAQDSNYGVRRLAEDWLKRLAISD